VTAYAIVQRVPNPAPRLRRTGLWPGAGIDGAQPLLPEQLPTPRLEADDPEGLAERFAAVRAAFAQTTWYLLNPDGWR
jgi:hypothetical protein